MNADPLATVTPEELEQLGALAESAASRARMAARHAETGTTEDALASIASSLAVLARIALTDPGRMP